MEHESSNLLDIDVNTDKHEGWILLTIGLLGFIAIFLVTARAVQYITFADPHHQGIEYELRTQASVEMRVLLWVALIFASWKDTNLILSLTIYVTLWTVYSSKSDFLAILSNKFSSNNWSHDDDVTY